METRVRTAVKAVLWTVIGLAVMTLVGLWHTGSVRVGGRMALINAGLGLAMYAVYERLWARIRWGMEPRDA